MHPYICFFIFLNKYIFTKYYFYDILFMLSFVYIFNKFNWRMLRINLVVDAYNNIIEMNNGDDHNNDWMKYIGHDKG